MSMKDEVLNELQTIWPRVLEAHNRLLSSTFRKFPLFQRQESQSLSSSSSNDINSTMQCWPACEPEILTDRSMPSTNFVPCEFCFQPSSSVIMTDTSNEIQERLCSDPVRVPSSSPIQPQSHSSGFGNGLSPTTNYWSGGDESMSRRSSIVDDYCSNRTSSNYGDSSITDGPDDDFDVQSFEILSFKAAPESSIYTTEFPHTTSASQNNVCECCKSPFATVSNTPARRCHYYGKLYCGRCHTKDLASIPAKIIESFDMHLYPVCRRAKSVLQSNSSQPIFDIYNDNINLYQSVPLLAEVKIARTQFQNVYAYISTCKLIENELHDKYLKEFYARDYFYQSIHLYSSDDLLSLKKILNTFRVATARAKQHIYGCLICREKGFSCEVCKDRKEILYPFDDVEIIGRCEKCMNIYHRRCWDFIEHDCPKCYRLVQRRHEQENI